MRKVSDNRGFTLIELLISMAVLGLVLAALTSLFVSQSRHHTAQNEILEMQGNARAAMEFVTRTISGLRRTNPTPEILREGEGESESEIRFNAFDDDFVIANSDTHRFAITHGGADGPNTLTYGKVKDTGSVLGRPDRDPLALNITKFRLQRFTSADELITANDNSSAAWQNTARIDITITAQTARRLPTTNDYGRITLTSSVYLRN